MGVHGLEVDLLGQAEHFKGAMELAPEFVAHIEVLAVQVDVEALFQSTTGTGIRSAEH